MGGRRVNFSPSLLLLLYFTLLCTLPNLPLSRSKGFHVVIITLGAFEKVLNRVIIFIDEYISLEILYQRHPLNMLRYFDVLLFLEILIWVG